MKSTVLPFVLLSVSIIKGQGIGDECKYDDGCFVEHTFCKKQKICECKENFIPDAKSQRCIARIGAVCQSRHDCSSLEHSTCVQGECNCESDHVPNAHGTECLQVVKSIEGNCLQDNQCQEFLGDLSYCHRQHCECMPNHHFSTVCVPSKRFGELCRNSSECFSSPDHPGALHCSRNGRCECIVGYHSDFEGGCTNGAVSMQNRSIIGYLIFQIWYILFLS